MKFSNLWEDKFVDQVQVVAYYHQWKDEARARGGQFALWTDTGEPHLVNPDSGTASIVDGSKNVHTATVYWPDHPAGPPPVIDKEKDVFLAFRDQTKVDDDEGELTWDVIQDGKILRSYNESEIRFSLVYVVVQNEQTNCKQASELRSSLPPVWLFVLVVGCLCVFRALRL